MDSIGRLRSMNSADLKTVFEWRNSDRVRKCMFNSQLIQWEDHCQWFEKIKTGTGHHVLIFEYDNRPAGLVQFLRFDHTFQTGYWGFYLGEIGLPQGTGTLMGELALKYYFKELKMRKLCAEVLGNNHTSLAYHLKLGFSKEGVLRKQVLHENNGLDIVLFGLLEEEWREKK